MPPITGSFRIGDWDVDPTSGQISRRGGTVRLEARTMRLLVYLAERAGQVVSIDELLKEVWPGVIVTSDSVYQAVASLRRELGDDPKQPTYIATVPRLGYKMVAKVTKTSEAPVPTVQRRGGRFVVATGIAIGVAICLALGASYAMRGRATASIAVVPFLDLTDGMSHEYFADGMTEEVIDKLSKVHGFRVAAPTTSFYLKNKPIAVTDIAKQLDVTYVLDGSVRKSHTTFRVAARLSRGDDGMVVWSETYDRPAGDMLAVQDDIATQVTRSLSQTTAR